MESLAGWAMDRYPGAEVSRAIERFLTSHLERFEGLRAQRVGEAMVRYAAGRDETPRDGIGLSAAPQTFQEILRLEQFWSDQGARSCSPTRRGRGRHVQPGHVLPRSRTRALEGRVRRALAAPQGRRYGENPNRLQNFYQYQVALKPAPADVLDLYLQSLRHIGIDLSRHDVRFVEDDWESPTLGAWGLGWEVWLDGQEITQFTYFQQSGGYDLEPVTAEITYGIERIACYLQGVERIMDLQWSRSHRWDDLFLQAEIEWCRFNFEKSDPALLFEQFEKYEREAMRLLKEGLVLPGYDYVEELPRLQSPRGARRDQRHRARRDDRARPEDGPRRGGAY